MSRRAPLFLLPLVVLYSCSAPREYELRGQVLAVDRERLEITIKHDDIKGFMPAMTMPFKVREARLLDGREPGDLVRATLVVEDAHGYLTAIERVGHAPVTEPVPVPRSDVLTVGSTVPDARFTDQDGHARRFSEWRGKVVAVTFIYTRCPLPDFCPRMDRHFAAVQTEVAKDPGLRGRVHLVSISFDPAYDTPPVLAAHARRVSADTAHWTFLTGERKEVDAFAARFGVSIVREEAAGAEIVHNLRTVVVDPDGRVAAIFNGNDWTPAQLLEKLRN